MERIQVSSTDEWIKKMWYIYRGILYGNEKEGSPAICDNMDGPCIMLSEISQREGQVVHGIT